MHHKRQISRLKFIVSNINSWRLNGKPKFSKILSIGKNNPTLTMSTILYYVLAILCPPDNMRVKPIGALLHLYVGKDNSL